VLFSYLFTSLLVYFLTYIIYSFHNRPIPFPGQRL